MKWKITIVRIAMYTACLIMYPSLGISENQQPLGKVTKSPLTSQTKIKPSPESKTGKPLTPMSGDGQLSLPHQLEHLELPKTMLQVKRLGGDLETWDSYGSTDTSYPKMDFQWKTEISSVHTARWEVSQSPDFPTVIAQGAVSPMPSKGKYGRFSIDLETFSGDYTKPFVFYVRVKPLRYNIAMSSSTGNGTENNEVEVVEHDPSLPVRITLTEAGSTPQTEFNLPVTHLKVVYQKILVVDDSDDLSGGDFVYKFIVNGTEKVTDFADDKFDSGDMIELTGISLIITKPPHVVGTAVIGCDNDEVDIGVGPAFVSADIWERCGDDPDTASVNYDIFTGTKFGRWHIPYRPFAIYAKGESLKFEVHGYYEMYCDPCP